VTRTLLLSTLALIITGCFRSLAATAALEQAAVDLDCPQNAIRVKDFGAGSVRAAGCEQTAMYKCTEANRWMTCVKQEFGSQDSRPVRYASGEAPAGAFGIQFGDSLDDFETRCRDRKHHFEKFGTDATCSGMLVDAEFAATVGVGTCDEGICSLTLQRATRSSKELLDALGSMRANLTKRYGAPTQFVSNIPEECDGRVPECLAERSAKISFQWAWRDGFTVDLVPARTSRGDVVSLAYATPNRSKSYRSTGY
jgi:hypothetical protein